MYLCSYCQSQHEDETKGEEHIIPRIITFNKEYILETTCQFWNQYMSHSFEKGIVSSKFMKFIINMFAPKKAKKPSKLGEVSTEDGMTYPLFRLGNQEFLCKAPETKLYKTNEILIKFSVSNGQTFEYMLKLPFEYIATFSGPGKLSKPTRREKQVEADKKRLQDYFNELYKNPGLNKEFEAFLKENRLCIDQMSSIKTEQESSSTPDSIITNALPRKFTFEPDLLAKFFIKIAFTHAMKQLGEEIVQEPIVYWLLQYLKSGHLEETFVNQLKAEYKLPDTHAQKLFRSAKVGNKQFSKQFYWWNGSTEFCINYIKENWIINPPVYAQPLVELLAERERNLRRALKYTKIKLQDVDEMIITHKENFRYHSVILKHKQIDDQEWTYCEVKLFGGIFDASVYLADRFLSLKKVSEERIEF